MSKVTRVHNNPNLPYFMTTWVQGIITPRGTKPALYPPASWNQVERTITSLNKTDNYMEAFYRKFTGLVGPSKPNIWKFLKTLYMEQQQAMDELILRERVGDPPPTAKRPLQESKDRRILAIVERWNIEDTPLIEYLDSIRDAVGDD